MFTGIIESTGTLAAKKSLGSDIQLTIMSDSLGMDDVSLGDSIAINGVCLTVTSFSDSQFSADVSNETLRCTTLGSLPTGSTVNLEKALLPTTRLGGHLVSGHVDAVGSLISRSDDGRSECYEFKIPDEIKKYVAVKGSVCIDGISLTVNEIIDNSFAVNIVPHTSDHTNLAGLQPGDEINLEVDIIVRYLERLLHSESEGSGGMTLHSLYDSGFLTK